MFFFDRCSMWTLNWILSESIRKRCHFLSNIYKRTLGLVTLLFHCLTMYTIFCSHFNLYLFMQWRQDTNKWIEEKWTCIVSRMNFSTHNMNVSSTSHCSQRYKNQRTPLLLSFYWCFFLYLQTLKTPKKEKPKGKLRKSIRNPNIATSVTSTLH